jgi:membrane dipeptidase
VVVDAHNDLLGLVARRDRADQGEYFHDHWLPELRAGGVNVQVLPAYSEGDDLAEILRIVEAGHRVADENPGDVALCFTGTDIDTALAEEKIALILALEGCGAIGTDLTLLGTLFRLGVRIASFTHLGRTALADGTGEDGAGSRLTGAGIEALAMLEEAGVLMDVSHLSASCLDDVFERASRPVIASHSSAFALCRHHRNLTDERIRAIAATNGVVGVNFFGRFVDPHEPTLERIADHVVHVASVAGPDHVGLGPDFIEEYAAECAPRLLEHVIPGLGGPRGLPLVTDVLVRKGLHEREIRAVLGENWLRLFRAELGKPAA